MAETGSQVVNEQVNRSNEFVRRIGWVVASSVALALVGSGVGLVQETIVWLQVRQFTVIGAIVPLILVGAGLLARAMIAVSQSILHAVERATDTDLDGGGIGQGPQVKRVGMARQAAYPRVQYRDSARAYDVRDVEWLLRHIWPADGVSIEGYKPPAATSFVGKVPPSGEVLANYAADVQPFFDACYGMGLITNWGEGKTYHLARTLPYARRAWQE